MVEMFRPLTLSIRVDAQVLKPIVTFTLHPAFGAFTALVTFICLVMGFTSGNALEQYTVSPWDQCGGKGGICQAYQSCTDGVFGAAQCTSGYLCTRQTEWYWQCVQVTSNAPNNSSSTVPASTSLHNTSYNSNMTTTPGSSSGSIVSANNKVAAWGQCGGKRGDCQDGTYSTCSDAQYSGCSCEVGYTCVRGREWYWQCVQVGSDTPNNGTITAADSGSTPITPGSSTATTPGSNSSSSSTTPNPASTSNNSTATTPANSNQIESYGQCGGKGGSCQSFACVDAVFTGASCASGLNCVRSSEWYWQCLP